MKKSIIAAMVAVAMAPAAQADVVIKLGGGLKASDKEKEVKFQTGGRLQWDYNNASLNDETDESDLHVRRARLFVKTQIGDWALKSQFNIAEEETEEVVDTGGSNEDVRDDNGGTVEDLYLQYKGFGKGAKITLGRQKAEFGLEELTSSKDITFLERNAATEAFAIGRSEGIQLQGDQGNLHYAFGIFEDNDGTDEASELHAVARVAYAFKSDSSLLHVGLALNNSNGAADEDVINSAVELAAVAGPFHAQAEYFSNDNDDSADNNAAYVQLGYIFTGESRPYKGGKFKRVKPAGSQGAFEVVARYTEGDGDFGDTELGARDASEYGIGFNWYANNNVRLGLTYSESEAEVGNDEGEEFRARAQLVF